MNNAGAQCGSEAFCTSSFLSEKSLHGWISKEQLVYLISEATVFMLSAHMFSTSIHSGRFRKDFAKFAFCRNHEQTESVVSKFMLLRWAVERLPQRHFPQQVPFKSDNVSRVRQIQMMELCFLVILMSHILEQLGIAPSRRSLVWIPTNPLIKEAEQALNSFYIEETRLVSVWLKRSNSREGSIQRQNTVTLHLNFSIKTSYWLM